MRIVIDLQAAQTESRFRGIGRYSNALAEAMIRRGDDHEIWLALSAGLPESVHDIRASYSQLLPPERIVTFEGVYPTAWPSTSNAWRRRASEIAREFFLAGLGADIVHIASLFEGAQDDANFSIEESPHSPPVAVTLYDLIPLLNKQAYLGADWAHAWYMDRVEKLKKARLLLAISEHARQEAIEALGIDPNRIVNISSAVSDFFHPRPFTEQQRALLERRFGLVGNYVMYSGAMESRKNVDRLVEAFALLPANIKETFRLVISGKVSPDQREKLQSQARGLGMEDRLVLTGYVTDAELIALYGGCTLYVFPSLHEGFGLPALEAMACGVPSIGSNTTSVPEVIGRPDALFDPTNVAEMAMVMARGISDIEFNASLRAHAPIQAAKFSWDESARRALDAFDGIHRPRNAAITHSWSMARASLSATKNDAIEQLAASVEAAGAERPSDLDLKKASNALAANEVVAERCARTGTLSERLTWRLEGPFDSSYSLALMNREIGRALSRRGHDVAMHSTEGPGDFPPDADFLVHTPDIQAMYERAASMPADDSDIVSRDLYPPRVFDMDSRINYLHAWAWEESGVPHAWVDDFNDYLQGMTLISKHVEKILIDNGVSIPLSTCGAGVDHWHRIDADESFPLEAREFRFLHVSSCFPRKGADVLLEAYGDAFTDRDPVSLIIKTFPNPHNQIHEWLNRARSQRQDFPHVVIIEQDLSEECLKGLYQRCHALVAPSRAEGFGLPIAEAMLSGLSVVTTNWSGQLAFCNDHTAWMVDYSFARSQSHIGQFNSVWAEPDRKHLASQLLAVHAASPAERSRRVDAGRRYLEQNYSWDSVAARLEQAVRRTAAGEVIHAPKTAWVTSWNTACGIATYAGHLISAGSMHVDILAPYAAETHFPDGENVQRLWRNGGGDELSELSAAIDSRGYEALVVQFQYSFYDFAPFAAFLHAQVDAGRTVVVVMHATQDAVETPYKRLVDLVSALGRCARVLVHAIGDLNRLKAHGVIENVALFPHGVIEKSAETSPASSVFTVASYGFFLPHKGLQQLVKALAILVRQGRQVRLKMVNAEFPDPASRFTIDEVREIIAREKLQDRVDLITDFLADEESLAELAAADLVIYPYQKTGESASGAVRYGLAVARTVAVTPISIFDDIEGAAIRLPGLDAQDIAKGIANIMDAPESEAILATRERAKKWREAHGYGRLARRLSNMVSQLHVRRGPKEGERNWTIRDIGPI